MSKQEVLEGLRSNNKEVMKANDFTLVHYTRENKLRYSEIQTKLGDDYKTYKQEERAYKAAINNLTTELGVLSIKKGVFKGYEAKLIKLHTIPIITRNGELDIIEIISKNKSDEVSLTNANGFKKRTAPILNFLINKAKQVLLAHVEDKDDLTFVLTGKSGLELTYKIVVDEFIIRPSKHNTKTK